MAINWFAGQPDRPWSHWYMPRPVVTQEDAEEEVAPSEITPVTPYPYPYNMADPHVSGDDDHFSTSIDPVRATRQITDSMMMSLSNIGVNDIEFEGDIVVQSCNAVNINEKSPLLHSVQYIHRFFL